MALPSNNIVSAILKCQVPMDIMMLYLLIFRKTREKTSKMFLHLTTNSFYS